MFTIRPHFLAHSAADMFPWFAGETHSVQEFCDIAFSHAGMKLKWEGSGVDEVSRKCVHACMRASSD
jgi:GDP-D-mannose dehydratase